MTTAVVVNASTIVTVELIDEITVTVGPILTMTIGIDVIIVVTTAAMTDANDYRRDDYTDRRDGSDHCDDRHDDRHNDRRDDRHRQDDHNRQDNNRKKQTPLPQPKGGNPNGAFQKANREINFIIEGHQAIKTH
jgi:hypothetical protein